MSFRKTLLLSSIALFGLTYGQTNLNCALIVPNNPLSAKGLATPYLLTNIAGDANSGTCDQGANAAFVEAVIINTDTGAVTVYSPLVINRGTQAAVDPTVPTLPKNNVVGIWFGFNGGVLKLQDGNGDNGLTQGKCVNGLGKSLFGQFAYCNARAFFQAANLAIKKGMLKVPALGTAKDGKPCPTVRDFSVVDQDQSDNVLTSYLMIKKNGQNTFAQDTPANRNKVGQGVITNASDNRLVNTLIDVAFGCVPWTVKDITDPSGKLTRGALALNELFAAARQSQPVALIPENNPMAQVNGASNLTKINLYRAGVNQPLAKSLQNANGKTYCSNFIKTAFSRLTANKAALKAAPSPDKAAAANLFDFLTKVRFPTAIGPDGLQCQKLGFKNPFLANGLAEADIDLEKEGGEGPRTFSRSFTIGVSLTSAALFVAIIGVFALAIRKRKTTNDDVYFGAPLVAVDDQIQSNDAQKPSA